MKDRPRHCNPGDHAETANHWPHPDARALDRAARLFRAMGDAPRLHILHLLAAGEACVGEIVAASGEKFSTVSQRLRVLRSEGLVARRRDRSHVYYALADGHVRDLVSNALAHAGELDGPISHPAGADRPRQPEGVVMSTAHTHADHEHQHGPGCGHTGLRHDGHTDYLHDGHLHHQAADGSVTEHSLPVGGGNPSACTPSHDCGAHSAEHVHGPGCGHEAVPHGDHTDYLVEGHLHHPHGDHCDDHGPVNVVK